MNWAKIKQSDLDVSAGCHINDVMNMTVFYGEVGNVSAGCHINDVMNATTVVL